MDDLEKIRKSLGARASDKSEEARLLALFEKACGGLASQTASGVRGEVEEALDGHLEAMRQCAGAIRQRLRE